MLEKILEKYHQLIVGILLGLMIAFVVPVRTVTNKFVSYSYFEAYKAGCVFMAKQLKEK